MTYRIFETEDAQELTPIVPTVGNMEKFMLEYIHSPFLDEQSRYYLVKKFAIRDVISREWEEEEEETVDGETTTRKVPYFSITASKYTAAEYVVAMAKFLFPSASVTENRDHLNMEIVHQAVADFLSRVQRVNQLGSVLSNRLRRAV